MKLTFSTTPPPRPLNFDDWKPHRGKALTHWLPDDEFEAAARKHGIAPDKDGFSRWGRWWKGDEIFLRARSLGLFVHEARHVETRSNFHKETGT